jgi:hypothetical protein
VWQIPVVEVAAFNPSLELPVKITGNSQFLFQVTAWPE